MLSIELIRRQPDDVRQSLLDRGEEVSIDDVLQMDTQRRQFIREGDELRSQRNEVSLQLSHMADKPPNLIQEMRNVGERISALEGEVKELEAALEEKLLTLPNIPLQDVPVGTGEQDNVVVRTWGEPPTFDFQPAPHWELGERLGIIDFSRGVKLAGSRFYTLNGTGARLERALINWMLDVHVDEHGYREVYLPSLVKRATMQASGKKWHRHRGVSHGRELGPPAKRDRSGAGTPGESRSIDRQSPLHLRRALPYPAYLHPGLPRCNVAPGQAEAGDTRLRGAVRGLYRRHGDRQLLHRA